MSGKNNELPSKEVVQSIRYTYIALASIVLIMGCWNIYKYLVFQKRWTAFPLTLMYIVGQLTLIFTLARLSVK